MVSSRRSKKRFHVRETVPLSGIYRVFHSIHRVSHEVTLLKDELFPPCSKCGEKVHFQLERKVSCIEDYDFRVRLFEVPHPEVKNTEEKTA